MKKALGPWEIAVLYEVPPWLVDPTIGRTTVTRVRFRLALVAIRCRQQRVAAAHWIADRI